MPSVKASMLEDPWDSLLEDSWDVGSAEAVRWTNSGAAWVAKKHSRSNYIETAEAFTRFSRRPRPQLRTSREVGLLFHSYANDWRAATMFESNIEKKVLHSSYQKIIGLGPDVLPFILQELARDQGHWFWALAAIVGEDKAQGCTTVQEATRAWISWGVQVGLADG